MSARVAVNANAANDDTSPNGKQTAMYRLKKQASETLAFSKSLFKRKFEYPRSSTDWQESYVLV